MLNQTDISPIMNRQKATSSVIDRAGNHTSAGFDPSFMTEPPQIMVQQSQFPIQKKLITGANNTIKSTLGGFEINKNFLKLGTAGTANRPVNFNNQRSGMESTAYDTSHSMM